MSDRSRLRLFILQLLVLVLFVTLGSRLWFLQIMGSTKFVAKQESTSTHKLVTAAARGRILDAQGKELATNAPTYVVTVNIKEFPREFEKSKNPERAKVIGLLSDLLQIDPTELSARTTLCEYKDRKLLEKLEAVRGKCWNGDPYQPIPIMRDVAEGPAFLIEEHAEDFPGVDAGLEPRRNYPQGETAAHMLGYIQASTDDANVLVGRTGLELQYDDALRGTPGKKTVATNRDGLVTAEVASNDPVPGSDLVLSIDTGVQKVAEAALKAAIDRAHKIKDPCDDCPTAGQTLQAPAGAAVVLEAKTGRVAAMASYPTYDPATFLKPIVKDSPDDKRLSDPKLTPQLSRAYQGEYAPGSTFKHVSTVAAVQTGRSLQGLYDCPGTFPIGKDFKSNYEGIGINEPISWHRTLVESCDTVYYKIAVDDWNADEALLQAKKPANEDLQQWAGRFGFGVKTGIDLPNEVEGSVPTRQWLRELSARLRPSYCKQSKESKDPRQIELFTDLCQNGSRYRAGDHANAAVGQGYVTATPLQIAVSYAALVNGGNLMEPRVAKAIVGPGGAPITPIEPKVRRKLDVDPALLDYLRVSLADVPKVGTARCAFGKAPSSVDCKEVDYAEFPFDQLDVGGKTGTAEVLRKQDTSWFASFGPVSDPRYVVVVMVEQGGTGGTTAAPAVRDIWSGIYGLEGKPAALVDGALPTGLPVILRDGRIKPPGTRVVTVPSTPEAGAATPSTPDASAATPVMPASPSAPTVSLADPDLPGRRGGGLW